jgi:hypothetical protein
MKVDKETLVKHKFWVIAALCLPLTLFAMVYLATSVAGAINAKHKEVDKKIKDLKAFADPKRPDEVSKKKREAELHESLKDVVWEEAWQTQARQPGLNTWPEQLEHDFHFANGLFAMKVQAERTKTPPADQGTGELPKNQFRGEIIKVTKDVLLVQGREGKEGKGKVVTKPFQRTAQVAVTLSDDKAKDQAVPFEKLEGRKAGHPGDYVTITYQVGKYFGDPLTPSEQGIFRSAYKTQLLDILRVVDPVTATGKGVVQLKDWPFDDDVDKLPPGATFLNFVPEWKQNHQLSKEAWIAQEDLWIQRELYRLIQLANSFVSRFHGPGGAGKGKEFAFTNPYWELRLTLTADDKLAIKMKNLLSRRQRADVFFLVKLRPDGNPEKVFVGGVDPFNPGEVKDIPAVALKGGPSATGIYGVEQVLTPQTAAVRRIDQVVIGSSAQGSGARAATPAPQSVGASGAAAAGGSRAESHRLFPKSLVAFLLPGEAKEEEAKEPSTVKPSTPGLPPTGSGSGSGLGIMNPTQAGGKTDKVSPNGLPFERYLEVTDQARRLPVGLVLIVDQQHVGLVQAAFADSVLRFLTNQVVLNRYPHNLRSPEATSVAVGPKAGPPDLARAFGAGSFPGGSMPPLAGGFIGGNAKAIVVMPSGSGMPFGGSFMPGGGMPFGPSRPGASGENGRPGGSAEEPETNVELVLYGVVSLYERYPPRPAGH